MKSVYTIVTQGTGSNPKTDLVLTQPSGGMDAQSVAIAAAIAGNSDPSPVLVYAGWIGDVDIQVTTGGTGDMYFYSVGSKDSIGVAHASNIVSKAGAALGFTAWSSGTTYAEAQPFLTFHDFVDDGGVSYFSIQAANTNHTPASSGTWWTSMHGFDASLIAAIAGIKAAGAGSTGYTLQWLGSMAITIDAS